jgi:hypothetical protein
MEKYTGDKQWEVSARHRRFQEAAGFRHSGRAHYGFHRNFEQTIDDAPLLRFFLTQTNARKFRIREHTERYLAPGRYAFAAGDAVADDPESSTLTCVNCGLPATSPMAQTPGALVARCSFTWMYP